MCHASCVGAVVLAWPTCHCCFIVLLLSCHFRRSAALVCLLLAWCCTRVTLNFPGHALAESHWLQARVSRELGASKKEVNEQFGFTVVAARCEVKLSLDPRQDYQLSYLQSCRIPLRNGNLSTGEGTCKRKPVRSGVS